MLVATKRKRSGNMVGPDDIPVDIWRCLGMGSRGGYPRNGEEVYWYKFSRRRVMCRAVVTAEG